MELLKNALYLLSYGMSALQCSTLFFAQSLVQALGGGEDGLVESLGRKS